MLAGDAGHGKTATITVTAKVNRAGAEKNTASATSAGKDPKPNNNLASARTVLRPVLRLHKTATPKTVKAGGTITYHLKASNPTSVVIKQVKACDAIPLGLVFQGATPKAKLSEGKECWTIKTLGAGDSRTFTVHARALKGTSGTKTNHATVTGKAPPARKPRARCGSRRCPRPSSRLRPRSPDDEWMGDWSSDAAFESGRSETAAAGRRGVSGDHRAGPGWACSKRCAWHDRDDHEQCGEVKRARGGIAAAGGVDGTSGRSLRGPPVPPAHGGGRCGLSPARQSTTSSPTGSVADRGEQ